MSKRQNNRERKFPRRRRSGRPLDSLLIRFSNPSQITTILVQSFTTLSSNSSGVVAYALPFDLGSSGTNNVEHVAYLSNLFSQARIVAAYIQVLPYFDEVKSGYTGSSLAIGTNLTSISTPTSLGGTLDNADAKLYNIMNDTTSLGFSHKLRFSNLEFQNVTQLYSTPTGGAPGCIQFWGNQYPATVTIGIIRYKYIYQYKNRI
jgi:hypothetical protein